MRRIPFLSSAVAAGLLLAVVGRGKFIAIGEIMPGEKSQCSGDVKVTATSVSGQYTCIGVGSYDPPAGMGKVDIKVRFTADS